MFLYVLLVFSYLSVLFSGFLQFNGDDQSNSKYRDVAPLNMVPNQLLFERYKKGAILVHRRHNHQHNKKLNIFTSTTLSSFNMAGSISMNSLIYVRGCHAKICIGVHTKKYSFTHFTRSENSLTIKTNLA